MPAFIHKVITSKHWLMVLMGHHHDHFRMHWIALVTSSWTVPPLPLFLPAAGLFQGQRQSVVSVDKLPVASQGFSPRTRAETRLIRFGESSREPRGMENHGARYETRFKLMRESVLAMKALWIEDEASFHGEMVSFDPAWAYPKPTQKPHPPVILGGETRYTLRRVIDYGDGWFPRASAKFDPVEGMSQLRQAAAEAGRDMAGLSMSVFRAPPDRSVLDSYAQAGVQRAVLHLPSVGRDEILKRLDSYSPLLA
jgi:hypothetical protein